MRLPVQSITTSGLLTLLLLVLYAYINWEQWFDKKAATTVSEGSPEMTATKVQQLSFNELGEKHYLLEADSMMQYLKQDQNLMIRPVVLFFKEQTPSWQTESEQAVATNNGGKLLLSGQVRIQKQGTKPGATLETDTLTLYPDRYFATTEDKVIIRHQGAYIEAVGLDADLNNNKLVLRNKVTSIYEPEKS